MKGRVTVIDDDNDLRSLLQIALKLEGFEVNGFANGDEFLLSLAEPATSDLYVIDINLGGLTGFEICRAIRAKGPTSKKCVILISANPEVQQLANEVGADDYMLKPFSQRDLIKKVAALLKH
jgi:DNA-binding response OmpR family regulator